MKSKNMVVDKKRLSGTENVQDILQDLKKTFDGLSDASKDVQNYMDSFAEQFVQFLLSEESSTKERIKKLAKGLFKFSDLLVITLEKLMPEIVNAVTKECKWKIVWFLRFLPLPTGVTICGSNKKGKALKVNKKLGYEYLEKTWLQVSGLQVSQHRRINSDKQ